MAGFGTSMSLEEAQTLIALVDTKVQAVYRPLLILV